MPERLCNLKELREGKEPSGSSAGRAGAPMKARGETNEDECGARGRFYAICEDWIYRGDEREISH